ncbi:MAG: hypothetical protein K2G09_08755 [Paramuribaculum sp.]|nr:hypothetical protein [Paramuribaculum sp.]
MNRVILLILSLILAGNISIFAQYQVNHISTTGENMTFRVVGYGKNSKKASDNAELSVIKALMFEGIPNSQQHIPMVPETEAQALKKHKNALNSFFAGEYKSEIVRSVIVRKFGKDANKQKTITLEVTVNIRALRNKLERIGVIRKFGL